MSNGRDFYRLLRYAIGNVEDGYSIYNQSLLNRFLDYADDNYIVITTYEDHQHYTFIKIDVTDKGQSILEFSKL